MLIASIPSLEGLDSVARHHSFVHVPSALDRGLDLTLPSYTIYGVLEGFLSATVDSVPVPLKARSILIGNPGQTISIGRQQPGSSARVMIVSIAQTALAQAHEELKEATHNLFSGSTLQSWPISFNNRLRHEDSYISPVLRRIGAAVDAGTLDNIWLEGQLTVLGERLLLAERRRIMKGEEGQRRATSPLSARLIKVRDYIDERYQQPLRLEHLARVVYASPYHFLRMFKEAYGQTPHQYLIQRRLDASRNLLETTSLRINEISERVGFQNANGFYKAFKRRYDCSPAAFRDAGR